MKKNTIFSIVGLLIFCEMSYAQNNEVEIKSIQKNSKYYEKAIEGLKVFVRKEDDIINSPDICVDCGAYFLMKDMRDASEKLKIYKKIKQPLDFDSSLSMLAKNIPIMIYMFDSLKVSYPAFISHKDKWTNYTLTIRLLMDIANQKIEFFNEILRREKE
jgi:hypothetical protein